MNQQDLIRSICRNAGIGRKEAGKALDAVLVGISKSLQQGEKVRLTGFGSFEVKTRAARMGRHPKTGKRIRIPASKAVSFKCGKALKNIVNI